MRFIVLIILLCLASCTNNKKPNNIEEFNFLISEAEDYILTKNYSEALKKYEIASEYTSPLFAVDIYNAILSAILAEEWDIALDWSKKLADKGVKFSFFNKSVFDKLKANTDWKKFKATFQKRQRDYEKGLDVNYIDSLKILTTIDQQEYCKLPSKTIDLKDAFVKTKFLDSLLKKLIKKRGYPTEEMIGANIVKDTSISPLPKFYSLLRHSYQANSNLLESDFKNAVEAGFIKKEIAEKISGIDNADFVVIDCKIYENKFSNKDSLYMKKMRDRILFNNSKTNGFVIYAPLAIFKGAKIEDFKDFYNYVDDYNKCKE